MKKDIAGFGATPEDWNHFAATLGLQADLLPVVSNPNGKVSALSRMKSYGKTPRLFNNDGEIVGFTGWTQHSATLRDVTKWQAIPDYGICLQTRSVRAFDVDVEDAALAEIIRLHIDDFLALALDVRLPARTRGNSSKFLLPFKCTAALNKRILKVDGGAIELLANGQQFVACGTHPSGVRYQWPGGLPAVFPDVDIDTLEHLWASLEKRFGIEKTIEYTTARQLAIPRTKPLVADDVVLYLYDNGHVISEMPDGRLNVVCPWRAEHTQASGDTESQWFPAGTGGFEQGHYRCLHAHCAHRTDDDFLHASGYTASRFEVVVPQNDEPALPKFKRNPETGKILASQPNLAEALRCEHMVGASIGFDEFRDEVMWSAKGAAGWQLFKDADFTRLTILLEQDWGFNPISREKIKNAVYLRADENRFDTAQLWLKG